MRLKFLGDSYDIVKRSLLIALSDLGPWVMHPMLTDRADAEHGIAALERMMGVRSISTDVLTKGVDRESFFASALSAGHLFIDPNTGLRVARVGGKRAIDFLFMDELVRLAEARPGALTMVFDQSLGRTSRQADLEKKLDLLADRGISAFAYFSHACFVIAGHDPVLVEDARARLLDRLGLPDCRLLANGRPVVSRRH